MTDERELEEQAELEALEALAVMRCQGYPSCKCHPREICVPVATKAVASALADARRDARRDALEEAANVIGDMATGAWAEAEEADEEGDFDRQETAEAVAMDMEDAEKRIRALIPAPVAPPGEPTTRSVNCPACELAFDARDNPARCPNCGCWEDDPGSCQADDCNTNAGESGFCAKHEPAPPSQGTRGTR